MKAKKIATQIDESVFEDLKLYVKEEGRSISNVINEAVVEYLAKAKVRPAFKSSVDRLFEEHSDLLKILAK